MKRMFLAIAAFGFSGMLNAAEVAATRSADLKTNSFVVEVECNEVDVINTPESVVRVYKKVSSQRYGRNFCEISLVFKGSLKGKKITYVKLKGYSDSGYRAEGVFDVTL